jgi:hypothetical protein
MREFKKLPDLSDPVERERLSPAGITVFVNISKLWELTDAQALDLLGVDTSSTLFEWQARTEERTLDQDTLMRISYLVGIYKALHIYFGPDLANRWATLHNQNDLFAGDTPVDYMIRHGPPGMKLVRNMVDAWAAGS